MKIWKATSSVLVSEDTTGILMTRGKETVTLWISTDGYIEVPTAYLEKFHTFAALYYAACRELERVGTE